MTLAEYINVISGRIIEEDNFKRTIINSRILHYTSHDDIHLLSKYKSWIKAIRNGNFFGFLLFGLTVLFCIIDGFYHLHFYLFGVLGGLLLVVFFIDSIVIFFVYEKICDNVKTTTTKYKEREYQK